MNLDRGVIVSFDSASSGWQLKGVAAIISRALLRMGVELLAEATRPADATSVVLRPFDPGSARIVLDHAALLAYRHEALTALLVPYEVQALLTLDTADDAHSLHRTIALQEAICACEAFVVFEPGQAGELARLGAARVHVLTAPALRPPRGMGHGPVILAAAMPDVTVIGHGAARAEVPALVAALQSAFPTLLVAASPALLPEDGIHVHVGLGSPTMARILDSAAAMCPVIAFHSTGAANASGADLSRSDQAGDGDVPPEHERTGLIATSAASLVAAVTALRSDRVLAERLCAAAAAALRRHNAAFEVALIRLLEQPSRHAHIAL